MKHKIKNYLSKVEITNFDKYTFITLTLIIPIILSSLYFLGFYCNSNDIINDCPANNLVYRGNNFWSINAITSNFIHHKENFHIYGNISGYLIFLFIGYISIIFQISRLKIIKLELFSWGLVLTFVTSMVFIPLMSMSQFMKKNGLDSPIFGFSGITYAIIAYIVFTILTSSFYLFKYNKNIRIYYIFLIIITALTTILFFNYFINEIVNSIGNIPTHLFGVIDGVICGCFIFFIEFFKKILKIKYKNL